jgi:hypothetical protein
MFLRSRCRLRTYRTHSFFLWWTSLPGTKAAYKLLSSAHKGNSSLQARLGRYHLRPPCALRSKRITPTYCFCLVREESLQVVSKWFIHLWIVSSLGPPNSSRWAETPYLRISTSPAQAHQKSLRIIPFFSPSGDRSYNTDLSTNFQSHSSNCQRALPVRLVSKSRRWKNSLMAHRHPRHIKQGHLLSPE